MPTALLLTGKGASLGTLQLSSVVIPEHTIIHRWVMVLWESVGVGEGNGPVGCGRAAKIRMSVIS